MIEIGKQYKTVSGLIAEVFKINDASKGIEYPVIGAYLREDNVWINCSWTLDGKHFFFNDPLDLILTDFRVTKHTRHYKKPINYFSVVLNIHEEIKWLATDSSGNLCGHKQKPVLTYYSSESFKYNHGYWANGGDYIKLAQIEFDGDWRKSLMRVE